MSSILGANSIINVSALVDVVYNMYDNTRRHTGSTMSFNRDLAMSKSIK